jgi:glycerol-3-phosphate dehydrogenase (NAD(P)+)
MSDIAIVSAGSYGTALARVLSDQGHQVRLHVRETDTYHVLTRSGVNATYLPGVPLNMQFVHASGELAECVRGAEFVFLTVPSQYARLVMRQLTSYLDARAIMVLTSKGLEDTGATMSDIALDVLPGIGRCGLYGITFAKAIAMNQRLASMCVASPNLQHAHMVAELFLRAGSKGYRISLSRDLRGAELGGAMKNAYAISMGIFDAYLESTSKADPREEKRPRSSRYSLMSVCMLEFVQFGLRLGARLHTLLGPCGIGDLTACVSVLSRNYQYGRWMALTEVQTLAEPAPPLHEGYDTVKGAAVLLGKQKGLDMPILSATYDILFKSKKVNHLVPELLKQLSGCISSDVQEEFDSSVLKALGQRVDPPPAPEKKCLTAFISYRFSPEAEKFMKLIRSICDLQGVKTTTGTAIGFQPADATVGEIVRNKIRAADLYIALFPNDDSESTWLIEERAVAISLQKPMLVLVEEGTPASHLGLLPGNHPYHSFTSDSFPTVVAEHLSSLKSTLIESV